MQLYTARLALPASHPFEVLLCHPGNLQAKSLWSPSLLQLVPAVTELIIAELLYLQYRDRTKPMFLYINSTGTSRADGETVSPCKTQCAAARPACLQDQQQRVFLQGRKPWQACLSRCA